MQHLRIGWILLCFILTNTAITAQQQSSSAPSQEEKRVVIPFSYDPPLLPFLVVQVRINGEAPLPFMVDTDLNAAMLIDTQAAQRLNLHPEGETITAAPGTTKYVKAALTSVSLPEQRPGVNMIVPLNGG